LLSGNAEDNRTLYTLGGVDRVCGDGAAKAKGIETGAKQQNGHSLGEFLAWMKVRNTAEYTRHHRRACVARFIRWAGDCGLTDPKEVTRSILETYQRYLYHHRQKNGLPLTFSTQYGWLVPVRIWFRWLAKTGHVPVNPASDLNMPKVEKRLPRAVLSEKEAEQVILQPDVSDPLGLRDRAILETFYSAGIRRSELMHLKLYDLDRERGTLSIRQGKFMVAEFDRLDRERNGIQRKRPYR
jgi:integrase/recombinase XerD